LSLSIFPDGVENPANRTRIEDAARLLGGCSSQSLAGRLIAVENAPGAQSIYGRKPLSGDATIAVGNERRGLSRRTLDRADEIVQIPTLSKTVNTLNVAAAAAVAGWFVLRGSGAQAQTGRPETRRPSFLVVGGDHVEVGSTLRSAAAFGFRDVLLEDRGAGWFEGPSNIRREAMAAARRHKNPLRVHRATLAAAARFDEIVFVLPCGCEVPIHRQRLAHGQRQLVVVGATAEDIEGIGLDRVRVATLGLETIERAPLRLVASIALAEVARQVGRRRALAGRPAIRPPVYDLGISLKEPSDVLLVNAATLLEY
jgi:hypothetical protein